jgi:anaerobic selenocysteine-containing dehydrogenase
MIGHLERLGRVDHRFLAEHSTGAARLLEAARRWPIERAAAFARVEARDIARISEAYAEADPALVRCGWGVERNRNGEAAVAAILALPAVAGKFGKPGGGYALSSSEAYAVNSERLAGGPGPFTRAINMSQLGRVLLEEKTPPVTLLFVYDANPLVTLPDQNRVQAGLLRDDLFTVVFDQVLTDTALFADIVLPATTFLEQSEVSTSYGTYAVMLSEPVIPPVGEARPNVEVFRLLAERLGIDCGLRPGDGLLADALDAIEGPLADEAGWVTRGDGRLARLRRDGVLRFDFPGPRPVQFATAFPNTSDGRIHLWPDDLGPDPYQVLEDPADAEHPLALVSPSTEHSICSTLGEFGFTQAVLEMHPEDAAARRLSDGDEVRIHNGLGEVLAPMRTNSRLRPGVVYLPKGIWNRHTRNGRVGTALVPDALSAVSGGACFNDARVQVSPAETTA